MFSMLPGLPALPASKGYLRPLPGFC